MIQFRFAANSNETVIRWMRTRGPAIIREATRRMKETTVLMQKFVKAGKLSGQVLRNRTGNLRRAVNQRVEVEQGLIRGIVGVDVTARYGKAHEYGFQGRVMVKEYLRRTKTYYTVVHAHQRNMNLPARPFMRPTLMEFRGKILAEMAAAVKEGIKHG